MYVDYGLCSFSIYLLKKWHDANFVDTTKSFAHLKRLNDSSMLKSKVFAEKVLSFNPWGVSGVLQIFWRTADEGWLWLSAILASFPCFVVFENSFYFLKHNKTIIVQSGLIVGLIIETSAWAVVSSFQGIFTYKSYSTILKWVPKSLTDLWKGKLSQYLPLTTWRI